MISELLLVIYLINSQLYKGLTYIK